jgi:hypothetical protein
MSDYYYTCEFLTALLLTIASELPVAYFILYRHLKIKGMTVRPGRIVAAVVICNLTTLPYLWFVYPAIMDYTIAVLCGELTAFLVEAFIYWITTGAGIFASLLASLAANATSVLVGLIVMPPFE